MIPGIVNISFLDSNVYNENPHSIGLDIFNNSKKIKIFFERQNLYYVSNNVYSAHPSNDYGFIIMDKNKNILMVENEIDCLEIPYIDCVELLPNHPNESLPKKFIFFIESLPCCIYFNTCNLTNISTSAVNYYIDRSKEQRRNFKILK